MNSVLITGASTGIGEACALYFAERSWRVFAGVRKRSDTKRLAAVSRNIHPVTLDVTKPKQIAQATNSIRRIAGKDGLQGLVNNAGIAIVGPLEFLPITELRHQIDVNFLGQVEVTQACLPLLRLGRGRVVNISSISGRITSPFLLPYSSSKFALEAFTDGLRRELLPWKLHVASVEPGSIATPIWKKSLNVANATRAKLPRQAEVLYGAAMERARNRALDLEASGSSAEMVARVVYHALSARRPRTRYVVGRGTQLAIWLTRFLPDVWVDWVIGRALYR
jgi:NAD(P)-dependent dehydrogenase (short-subunit alcohol dehydrogenase family)